MKKLLCSSVCICVHLWFHFAAFAATPQFVDVAKEAGLTTIQWCGGPERNHLLESAGQGCAFVDYDNDGKLDIVLVNGWRLDSDPDRRKIVEKGKLALYHNLGNGTFENVADKAGIADDGWGCGVCAGDYDNDGFVDLYVTRFGPNRLYRNRGNGTFEQVAERAGVAHGSWSAGCSFFDADKDGDLDLYVACYVEATMEEVLTARRTTLWQDKLKVMAGPFGFRGARDKFYRNNGDGTFTDATKQAGLEDDGEGYGLGVLTSDLDRDGDIDIYVANDSNPNYLWRNNGDGTFTEIGGWSGAGLNADGKAQAGMGVDSADFDGDAIADIYVTNFARDYDTLYRGTGELYFEDISLALGLKPITNMPLSWGCSFLDFDNDADVDIFVASGHIYPQVDQLPELGETYAQRGQLMENRDGKPIEITGAAGPGLQIKRSMRGLAVGDYDNDGDLDLLITAIDSPPLLLRNDGGNAKHWLELRLLDKHKRDALGAFAKITAGGKSQQRELRSGSTYASQSMLRLHFGLGDAATIDKLEITWPSGAKTARETVRSNQLLTLREGE
ncbi:MAG: enediyne biosynthesis protein [Phycisphaerales bacterium]|jgi:hypothetical protein|nr:enediyne biosynthesis protein [Phycisphaerales bacterium]